MQVSLLDHQVPCALAGVDATLCTRGSETLNPIRVSTPSAMEMEKCGDTDRDVSKNTEKYRTKKYRIRLLVRSLGKTSKYLLRVSEGFSLQVTTPPLRHRPRGIWRGPPKRPGWPLSMRTTLIMWFIVITYPISCWYLYFKTHVMGVCSQSQGQNPPKIPKIGHTTPETRETRLAKMTLRIIRNTVMT